VWPQSRFHGYIGISKSNSTDQTIPTHPERKALALDPGSPDDRGVRTSRGGEEEPYLNGEESAGTYQTLFFFFFPRVEREKIDL
jgi:hypothetical protein